MKNKIMMKKQDIENILENYPFGKLKDFMHIKRYHEMLQRNYIVNTTSGKYFLKQYKGFSERQEDGLKLMSFLMDKRYPCIKLIKTSKNKNFVKYRNTSFAVFEFMDIDENKKLTPVEAYEEGKYLGMLHKLSRDFPIKGTYFGYDYFRRLFNASQHRRKSAPKKAQKVFEYMRENFKNLKCPKGEFRTACHVEFDVEHVRFKNHKLVKVIDWDLVSRDYAFYDFGTMFVDSFKGGNLDFRVLSNLIKGYESQRKLSKWEREHIFEALQFGIFKFSTWVIGDVDAWGWSALEWPHIYEFMKWDKENFNSELSKHFK